MKLNRKLLMVLALVLSVAMATSSTIAYLSDTASDVNVMTLGNVDIEQIEEKRDENGELIAYPSHPENQPLYPAVGDLSTTETELYNTTLDLWNNANVLDKFVTVENTGKSDAFVRTVFAVEDYEDNDTLLQLNWSEEQWTQSDKFADGVEIADQNGVVEKYDLYVVYYADENGLSPNTTTLPSLMQVAMPKTAENDDMAKYGDTMNILVVTQAMQTEGFDSAEAALTEGFYALSATSHPWADGIEDAATVPTSVSTAEELFNLLSNKQINDDLTISLAANIDMTGYEMAPAEINDGGSVTFVGNGFTISNLKLCQPNPQQNGMNNVGLFHLHSEYSKGGAELTISNLTIENASYEGNAPAYCDAAVIVGYANKGSTVNLNNVDIANGKIVNNNGNAAMLVGYTVGKVNFTSCDVQGYVTGERDEKAGAFVGTANTSDCSVSSDNCVNNTNAYDFGRIINGATSNGASTKFVGGTADLKGALKKGNDIILSDDIFVGNGETESNAYGATGISITNGQEFNGNNNTFGVNAWGTWDSAINTTGGTIKNVTINQGMRGIFINHNSSHSEPVILENVTIDGTVYTISCDQGTNQGMTATNSTFNGWTSYAATTGNVKFVDCSFGEGQGYAYCRPYAPTEFVDCNFEAGYEIEPAAAITFENCTLNGVALTAENLSILVIGDISKATVK